MNFNNQIFNAKIFILIAAFISLCFYFLIYYQIAFGWISINRELMQYRIFVNESLCEESFLEETHCYFNNYSNFEVKTCPDQPFISYDCHGGFGQQTCSLASLLFLQLEFGIPIALKDKKYNMKPLVLHYNNITLDMMSECNSTDAVDVKGFYSTYQVLRDMNDRAPQWCKNLLVNPIVFDKCTCPRKFLMQRREIFQEIFHFRKDLKEEAKSLLARIQYRNGIEERSVQLVSVHVKRKDVDKLKEERGLRPTPLQFYINAINYFRIRLYYVAFIVFSDDLEWCMDNLAQDDVFFSEPNQLDVLDFAAMSYCDHHIIGDGTFGFASALVGQGMVVFCPADYVEGPSVESDNVHACTYNEDFIPITAKEYKSIKKMNTNFEK